VADGYRIRKGLVKSCGCFKVDVCRIEKTKHHLCEDRLYKTWTGMKSRCYNPNSEYFHRYGGRGITMCNEWTDDFMAFYNWAIANGWDENKSRTEQTIDRINNELGYQPDNCRFASCKLQANNRSNNCLIAYNGTTHTAAEWGRITKMKGSKIRKRMVSGWDIAKSLGLERGEK